MFGNLVPSQKITYGIGSASFVVGASPADVISITGSATKIIRVYKVAFSGTQTTAGIAKISLIKRSAIGAGGTSTTETPAPLDSSSPAGTAVITKYTVSPTPGATIGTIWSGYANFPAPATAGIGVGGLTGLFIDFTSLLGEPLVLRGAAQNLCVNLHSVAMSGSNAIGSFVWTEE